MPGAAATLVPFAPTRALLCLYALDPTLTGSQAYRLVASRDVTTAALADEIRTRLNSAATGPPADQMLCPKDNGTTLDIYFGDSNHQIELEIGTSGCRAVTNGTYDARIAAAVPYLASIVPFPPGVE